MNEIISEAMLKRFSQAFQANAANAARMHAAVKAGAQDAAENHAEIADNPMIFSVELESGKITNQKSSGRCWLFAGLNTMRYQIMKKLNLDTFELSQSHLMFVDKLEKANYFLESILKTLDEPIGSRLLMHILNSPIQDGGQWDMFCALVDKYGCLPKEAMPESFHSGNSHGMNALITRKLREYARSLRGMHEIGEGGEALRAAKERMLGEVYQMLCICLGEPPRSFDFEYRDKDKQFHRAANLTPRAFYEAYVGSALDEYVAVINAPTADKPYDRSYTVDFLGNVVGGRAIRYLNLPSEALKALSIAQLQDGEPVWFGCDVGKMLMRGPGIMGMRAFDYEAALGVPFSMSKAERLDYGESVLTHAMVFLGVNLVDGKPNRWKVENSWGKERGQEGYYLMTDEWFDEYNYEVVVRQKYLSPDQLRAYQSEPIVLSPWDPMGSLA